MPMSGKIKLLIVDDSYFMRKLIRDLLSSDPDIQIIGEAKNGVEAIKMANEFKPNVITMDYNMPEMNGAEATSQIMGLEDPLPAILMLSALTTEGAEETFRCLKAGAVDFIPKPSGEISLDIDKISADLIAKVKTASHARLLRRRIKLPARPARKELKMLPPTEIIVIGSSTGGPPLLEEMLSKLPVHFKIPILVVQHMPEKFTKSLAERLDTLVPLHIKEAEEGDVIELGMCYIAPGGWHMVIETIDETRRHEHTLHMNKEPPQFGLRPAINHTLRSAAEHFGQAALGVILTGMGDDGSEGMKLLKASGGYVIAQNPETATIPSMPESIIRLGIVDEVMDPDDIIARLIQINDQYRFN